MDGVSFTELSSSLSIRVGKIPVHFLCQVSFDAVTDAEEEADGHSSTMRGSREVVLRTCILSRRVDVSRIENGIQFTPPIENTK